MTAPITITVPMTAWMTPSRDPARLIDALRQGKESDVVSAVYLSTDLSTDSIPDGWTLVGEGRLTLTVTGQDHFITAAGKALADKLVALDAAYQMARQEILSRISKLQALTYEAPAEVAA